MHGARYLLSRDLPWGHRVAWLVAVAASAFGCCLLMAHSLDQWLQPSFLAVRAERLNHQDVAFPAISFCRNWSAPDGTFQLLTQDIKMQRKRYLAARTLCGNTSSEEQKEFTDYAELWEMTPKQFDAEFMGINVSASIFMESSRYCLTANIAENGVLKDRGRIEKSLLKKGRKETVRLSNALKIGITEMHKPDQNCKQMNDPYLIFAHHPGEYPFGATSSPVEVHLNVSVILVVMVDAVKPSDSLEESPLSVRRCYFPGERKLSFFNDYTRANCLLECAAAAHVEKGGCPPPFVPRPANTDTCSVGEMTHDLNGRSGSFSTEACDCLPPCIDTSYRLRIQEKDIGRPWMLNAEVTFSNIYYTAKMRTVLSTLTDLLASCAGFLAMFLGVSILTIFEMLYHIIGRTTGFIKLQSKEDSKLTDRRQLEDTDQYSRIMRYHMTPRFVSSSEAKQTKEDIEHLEQYLMMLHEDYNSKFKAMLHSMMSDKSY